MQETEFQTGFHIFQDLNSEFKEHLGSEHLCQGKQSTCKCNHNMARRKCYQECLEAENLVLIILVCCVGKLSGCQSLTSGLLAKK